MSAPWWIEMRAEQLVLELREILVRYDENIAAHTLMQQCVPYFLDDATHPRIAQARADQAQMVDHIVGKSYARYYETNHHERPFEEQYQCQPEEAHNHLHRVRFLRAWIDEQLIAQESAKERNVAQPLHLLDVACNDGWLAKNLEGRVVYHGIDLNPHCIKRAKGRDVPHARFQLGFAESAEKDTWPLRQPDGYDVVVAYELLEHVKDPHALLAVMVACCKPRGSLFVSTPLGAGTGGNLPMWHHVEPKGHVRAYTPQSFAAVLSAHGETRIEISQTVNAGELMVARVDLPEIVKGDDSEHVRADRAGGKGDPRPPRGSRAAER